MADRSVAINFKGSVGGLIGATKSAGDALSKIGSSAVNVGKMFTSAFTGNFKPLVHGITGAIASFAKVLLVIPSFLIALVNPFSIARMAMSGFGTAISASSPQAFVAATRNMAPAMQQAVIAVRSLQPLLKNLFGIIQQGFWKGFSEDVVQLAHVYFPVLNKGFGSIGTMLGNLREQLVQFFLKPQVVAAIQAWMTAFTGLGGPILALVEKMLPTMLSLFTSFSKILIAIVPLITVVVGWFAKLLAFVAPLISGLGSVIGGVSGALGGAAGGLGAGGGAGGGGGGAPAPKSGGFFSHLFSGIGSFFSRIFGGGKALGGPVSGGMNYLVGEKGAEVLSMGSSGFITPNRSTGPQGHTFVTVKIGEQDLRGIVNHEISKFVSDTALTARMGRGQLI